VQPSDGPTVAEVGEDALVRAVVRRLRGATDVADAVAGDAPASAVQPDPGGRVPAGRVLVGPGDDAAVVALDGPLVTSTDTLVEGVDFRLDWSSPEDVGRKAAVQVLADVEAMGATPVGLLVALVVPGRTPLDWCLRLADGLGAEAVLAGAVVLGGDVADGDALVLTGTSIGALEGGRPAVGRGGARPGDVVALGGLPGRSAAGLAVLSAAPAPAAFEVGAGVEVGAEAVSRVVAFHRAPTVDHTAGPRARAAGATALIDVSDGLVRDAVRVAEASGVVVGLDPGSLSPAPEVVAVAEELGADPLEWVLTSGEEHVMLGCFPPEAALPDGFRAVGRVREVRPGEVAGVEVGGRRRTDAGGWTHYGRRP
jgi:thiamine-monophosphate kinase